MVGAHFPLARRSPKQKLIQAIEEICERLNPRGLKQIADIWKVEKCIPTSHDSYETNEGRLHLIRPIYKI